MSILSFGMEPPTPILYPAGELAKFSITELQKLKTAIVGDHNSRSNGERVSFGFVGDIGSLPSSLDRLRTRGGLGLSTLDTNIQIAYGWVGSYIESAFSSDLADFKTDGWGNLYAYSTTQYANAPGDTVLAKITSLGADGSVGGSGYNADIFVEIKKDEVLSDINGCVSDAVGGPIVNAIIRIYEPDGNGGLSVSSDNTDVTGCYTVLNVTQGIRALTIQRTSGIESEGYRSGIGRSIVTLKEITGLGTIILVGIPLATGDSGNDLDFEIQNLLGENVDIIDFSVVYTPFDVVTGPTYDGMKMGGPTIWTAAATRAGSGVRLATLNTFSSTTITDNQTKRITLENFQNDAPIDINMYGAEFTATFYASDGSQYVIGPFLAGGAPTLQLVGEASRPSVGVVKIDVRNNTGADIIITDMIYVYTPFDATTGPRFDKVRFSGPTAYSAASFSTGSGDLLSTIDTFVPQQILNGETVAITTSFFKNNKNRKQNLLGYEFTVTFFTSTTQYDLGPFIVF